LFAGRIDFVDHADCVNLADSLDGVDFAQFLDVVDCSARPPLACLL
jgi:hypothetical protein